MVLGNYRIVTLTYRECFIKTPLAVLIRDGVQRIGKYLPKCGKFFLAAELTEKGMLHWHYWIDINDSVKHKIFLGYWRRHFGFIKVFEPRNLQSAIQYVEEERNQVIHETFGIDDQMITNDNIRDIMDLIKAPIDGEPKTILDYEL